MALTEALRLLITADTAGAVRGIENVGRAADRNLSRSEKQLDRWGNRLTTIGTGLIAFGAVAAYGLGQAAKSASNLGEAVNASNVVFGDAVGIIDKYAQDSARSFGLSETAFRMATTQMGAQLKNLGFDTDEAAQSSVDLTQRAADMASVFNTDVTQATQAIGAALRGERDPIERFGVTINEAAVKAKAMELGLAGATGQLSQNAKAQASLALIMEQTNDIAGDFANTSDSMANKQRIVAAQFENLKASIGQAALPVMEDLLGVAQKGIGAFSGLNAATGGFVGKAATIATVASLGIGGLSLMVGQAIKMRDAFGTARDAAQNLARGVRSLGAAGTALVSLPTVLLAAAVALEQWNQAEQRSNVRRLTAEFLAAGESAAEMRDVLQSLVDHGPTELIDTFDQLASTNREAAERFIDTAEAAGASSDLIEQMRGHLETLGEAEQQTSLDTDNLAGSMDGAASSTQEATSALQDYADQLKAQFDPLFAYQDAVDKNSDALAEEAAAQAGLDMLRASGTATAEEMRDAEERLEDAHRGVQGSAVDLAGREAELFDAFERGDITAEQLTDEINRLEDQNYLSAAAAADLRAKIEAIKSRQVEVTLESNARNTARSIQSYIDGIRGRQVFVNVVETRFGTQRVGRFHEGGVVPGPRGQEVAAILQAGERVISLQEMDAMNGRIPVGVGGGGMVYNDHRTISITTGADPQAVVTALRRAGDLGMPITVRGRSL